MLLTSEKVCHPDVFTDISYLYYTLPPPHCKKMFEL